MHFDWMTKVGDTGPAVTGTVMDANGIVNLTEAASGVLTIVSKANAVIVSTSIIFVDRPLGKIKWSFPAGGVVAEGVYDFEVKITWNDGTVETIPKVDGYKLRVNPGLTVSTPS